MILLMLVTVSIDAAMVRVGRPGYINRYGTHSEIGRDSADGGGAGEVSYALL